MGDKESRPWIAFFSQSGKEIADISETLEKWPDLIITNKRPESLRQIDKRISNCTIFPNKPSVKDYEDILGTFNNPLITLNGWLRIIPEQICTKYEMYNNHPGLITEPEYTYLKGLNPQERSIKDKARVMGCVLHKVTSEVDEGQVLVQRSFVAENKNEQEIWSLFRQISLDAWIYFFREIVQVS